MGLLDFLSGAEVLRKPKSIRHNGKRLSEILEAHRLHFQGKPGGTRADLSGADLRLADLQQAKISRAPFSRELTSKAPICENPNWCARTSPAQNCAAPISAIAT